ncbi:hypothetical protein Tco_0345058 [Tanacetum coccineum]
MDKATVRDFSLFNLDCIGIGVDEDSMLRILRSWKKEESLESNKNRSRFEELRSIERRWTIGGGPLWYVRKYLVIVVARNAPAVSLKRLSQLPIEFATYCFVHLGSSSLEFCFG